MYTLIVFMLYMRVHAHIAQRENNVKHNQMYTCGRRNSSSNNNKKKEIAFSFFLSFFLSHLSHE